MARDLVAEVIADPTLPDAVRRALQSGQRLEHIKLDAEGRFFHEGEPINHPRILELFHRSIARTPGGTYVLHVPPFTYPIEVEDTPYQIRRVEVCEEPPESQKPLDKTPFSSPGGVRIWVSDGSEEFLDLATLRYDPGRGFTCLIKGGTMPARFSRPAYYALAQYVDIDEAKDDYTLQINQLRVPISSK